MIQNIIGGFFLMVFGIVIINVGIWVNRELNNFEYDKDAHKGMLISTCIIGIICYIIYIVNLLYK